MRVRLPTSSKREGKIFVSYRREDAGGRAGRLYEWLCERFGPERVFMDISTIKPGEDFVRKIESEVTACEAVVVVVGRHWLTCEQEGGRRLDDPGDFVRVEIASALKRDTLVIPLLVDGARMPGERDLPDELKPLARRNALEVSDERWEYDVGRLLKVLEERVEKDSAPKEDEDDGDGKLGLARLLRARPVRLFAALLVAAAVLAPQLLLAFQPEPVRLEETGRFAPAEARLGRERLTIEGPLIDSPEGLMLSHVGNPEEVVNLSFERARLDGDTLMQFGEQNPPTAPAHILFMTDKPEAKGEPCRTFVNVSAADASRKPSALHFSQTLSPGGDVQRGLDLEASGAQLLFNVNTSAPLGGDERAPGCSKLLKVAPGFAAPVEGVSAVAFIAEPDSATHLTFNPALAKNNLWQGAEGFFQPFALGGEEPAPFRARALKITARGEGGPASLLEARAVGEGWLTVESLSVGPDRLQVRASGVGLIKVYGEDYTDPLGRVRRHALASLALALLDVALLVWLARMLFAPRRPATG